MKKPFNYTLLAIIALAIPYTITRAETTPVFAGDLTAAVTPIKTPAPAKTPVGTQAAVTGTKETPPVESLSVRKAKAEADLHILLTQFNLFATRTQSTIDRLNAKKIDTTKAQIELTASKNALELVKVDLDAFAAMPVTEPTITTGTLETKPASTKQEKIAVIAETKTTEQDTAEIKASLKKMEDNLKLARTHLIDSLTALKTTVALTIDAQD